MKPAILKRKETKGGKSTARERGIGQGTPRTKKPEKIVVVSGRQEKGMYHIAREGTRKGRVRI